jgi:hypothetical protein
MFLRTFGRRRPPTSGMTFIIYLFLNVVFTCDGKIEMAHIKEIMSPLIFSYKLGITNPTNRNLILEIYKKRVYSHVISEHMHKQNLSMMHNLLATHGVK